LIYFSIMPSDNFPSSEYRLLDSLKPFLNFRKTLRYPISIGDDAAVRNCRAGETLVLTADSFVENVHFSFSSMSSAQVGYKAMAVNLSDCAAMAARPDGALVQIIFPANIDLRKLAGTIRGIYTGFNEACRTWNFPVIGGNLAKGPCWIIDITLIGRAERRNRFLQRFGAKSNDGLWVTGFPGQSAAGRMCLEKWGSLSKTPAVYRQLVKQHVRPVPRVEIGCRLVGNRGVHAAIDISDGVSKECYTLSYENKLGIIIAFDATAVCVSSALKKLGARLQKDWRLWFFNGGEDYELLFAASPAFDPASLIRKYKVPITRIGTFTTSVNGVFVRDPAGSVKPLEKGGWDHLKS
jgi:thiamine-monophosphate kinase